MRPITRLVSKYMDPKGWQSLHNCITHTASNCMFIMNYEWRDREGKWQWLILRYYLNILYVIYMGKCGNFRCDNHLPEMDGKNEAYYFSDTKQGPNSSVWLHWARLYAAKDELIQLKTQTESKGFWRWFLALRVNGFVDFVIARNSK
jgi:hypothetical protein